MGSEAPLAGADRSIPNVLADPAASFALKTVLIEWRDRDVVDAAADARTLCDLLEARCDRWLAAGS
ncbi:hypothetical protein E4M02_07205 [Brevundimonas sp. S30B]|uniref:hypothetical protein n=1 Tax=unclassified Brevundimonas TaxID=2622653 RepID=UPI0010726116|nr:MULTISPECIES: hypothetical protein [unclassified Brevundimonas]QBX37879.1 hypothetical protein E4M01_08935 [Brevundimonas sp. MF30-B]TFW02765.1 hypothetical protein E4M02_07205 [Brevundimonas sp. S30B]